MSQLPKAYKINFTELMRNVTTNNGDCTMCYDLLDKVGIAKMTCQHCKGKGKAAVPLTELFNKARLYSVYSIG